MPTEPSPELLQAQPRSVPWMLRWALVCGLVGLVSLLVSDGRHGQVMVWLANPVGAVALLRLPRRQWPMMLPTLLASSWAAYIVNAWLGNAPIGVDAPVQVLEMVLVAVLLSYMPTLYRAGQSAVVLAQVLLRGALLPAAVLAPLGGLVCVAVEGGDWHVQSLNWFIGHTIGAVAVLPLALAVSAKRTRLALQQLLEPHALGMLFAGLAVTLWAATSLPKPFVIMGAPMVWMAARTGLVATFAANALLAVCMAVLIRQGVLVVPPTSSWWGDALFYLSVLATLLPGLFLAVMSEGQRLALQVLADSEAKAKDQYFQTPAMLHSIDAQGRIVQMSRLWLETLGYTEAEVMGRHVSDFMTPDSARQAREVVIPMAVRNGRCDNIEYQLRKKDGSVCDVLLSAIWEYDSQHQPVRSLAVLQDVTEKKRLEARSHFAEHDALTGLPNRVLLQDRLKMLCAQHSRHSGVFAVGFLDLDHFKEVNDSYGHDAGDLLLKAVAQRLQSSLRASDTVCRLGGDEFVMIFSAVEGHEELHAVAGKLMAAINQPCTLGSGPDAPVVEVSGSLGMAVFPAHGNDPQTLLMHADQAMYAAKRSGRNRCEFYRTKV
ncbi:sensor domain-containing diguanylate cyclase [Rhodoferax bucti]|uniref:sensor domain-containing diguanylate cyclase n=1 Tax=Rhodoferax bucti TaxID=2576305 RepID=UPI001109B1BA|nr:sensor domain-containing diguanylate cyclase [Rhodoferax bucti]